MDAHRVRGAHHAGRRRRLTVVVVFAAVVVPLLVSMGVLSSAAPPVQVRLGAGAAWLSSSPEGVLTLVDGATERVIGSLPVSGAQSGDELQVHQRDLTAFVANPTRGTVSRIDGATHEQTASSFTPPRSGLRLHQNADAADRSGGTGPPDALYVVDPTAGVARVVDPDDLTASPLKALGARPRAAQSVVDDDGRLWVLDGDRGTLAWLDRTAPSKGTADELFSPDAALVLVQGSAALADPVRGRVGLLDDDGEVDDWSCLDVPAGVGVQLLGSRTAPEVFVVAPETGTLRTADLSTGDCGQVLEVAPPRSDLGPAVQSDRYLLVPDRGRGRALVVDLTAATRRVNKVALPSAAAGLEFVVSAGIVFYNDRLSALAGVLRLGEGGVWVAGPPLSKYGRGVADLSVLHAPRDDLVLPGPGAGGQAGPPPTDRTETLPPAGHPSGEQVTPAPPAPEVGAAPPRPPARPAIRQDSTAPATRDRTARRTTGGSGDGPGTSPHGRDTATDTDTDGRPPTGPPVIRDIAWTPDPVLRGQRVTFTADVDNAAGATWTWTLLGEDGDVVDESRAPGAYTYVSALGGGREFTIRLQVTGPGGAAVPQEEHVETAAARVPDVEDLAVVPSPPRAGEEATFTASETVFGAEATWVWEVRGQTTPTVAAPGAPFRHVFPAAGTYTVTLTVRSLDGEHTESLQLEVAGPADTTKPELTGLADRTATTRPGSVVVEVPFEVTATDDVDGTVPVTCDPASGSAFPVGPTRVTCTATDMAGNASTGSFTVRVTEADTTPPVIDTVSEPVVVRVEFDVRGTEVHFPVPSAVDARDGPVPVVCDPPPGTYLTVGAHDVSCTAGDRSGNTGRRTFRVVVEETPALEKAFSSGEIRADRWGVCGDMRAEYDALIPHDPRFAWDGSPVRLRTITGRTVNAYVVGQPVAVHEGLRVRVHIGTGCWPGGPGIRFEVSATFRQQRAPR